MHVAALEIPTAMPIYPSRALQVLDDPTLAALQWDKTPTKILTKYSDYVEVFSSDLVMELTEKTRMNKHAIKLIEEKQLPYGIIYALSLIELETLKTYIKTYLKTGFIRPSKSLTGASILFNKRPDGSLYLCVNY